MTWELSDLLRVIATTIVISIHASYHWWFGVNDVVSLNLEILINTFINQVGRWTVPIFVVLSGFALAKSEEKRPFAIKAFFRRRLWRIVPPYIIFSLLNIVGQDKFQTATWPERGQHIWQSLSTGMGDYHLYFLGIIFQCYIVYPFLRCIPFSLKNLSLLLVTTLTLFTLRWSSATFGFPEEIITFLPNGNHVIYWLSYFQIGIWLAKDAEWTNLFVSRWRSQTWGYWFAIAAILELCEFFFAATYKKSAEAAGHYARPTVVLLTLMFLLWSISWKNWQVKSFPSFYPNLKTSFQSQIKNFSNASFTTYLVHVWVLRVIAPLEMFGSILFAPLAISVSWLVGIALWQLMNWEHRNKPSV